MQFDIEAKDDNIRVTDVYVTNTIDGLAVLQRQLDALLKEQTELPDATTKALADAVTASGAIPASITTASGQLLQLANTLRAKHAALPYADVAAVKVDAVKVTGNDILMGGAITSYNTTFADTAFTGVIDYINVIGYGLNPLGTAVAIDLTNPTNSLVVNNAVAAYNVAWPNYQAKLDRVGTLTTEIANKRIEIASAEAAGGTIDLSSALRTSTLYMSNGRQVTGETIGRNVIHFQFGTEGIIINRDAKIKGEVRVAFHDSSTRSAELFQLSIMSGAIHDETPGTKNSMRILSESTGTEITRSAVDVNSKVHLLARSKPTVAMTSGFVSNSTELYRFTVTADSNNDLTLSGLTLQIGNKGVGNGKIEIRRDTINGSLVGERDITSATSTAGYVGDLAFIVNKDNGKISAGTTVTFYVQMASTGNTPTEGSREVRVVDAQYFDNVDTINQKTIIVKDYNVGIPTQISSFRYNN